MTSPDSVSGYKWRWIGYVSILLPSTHPHFYSFLCVSLSHPCYPFIFFPLYPKKNFFLLFIEFFLCLLCDPLPSAFFLLFTTFFLSACPPPTSHTQCSGQGPGERVSSGTCTAALNSYLSGGWIGQLGWDFLISSAKGGGNVGGEDATFAAAPPTSLPPSSPSPLPCLKQIN